MIEYLKKIQQNFPQELLNRPIWVGFKVSDSGKMPINLRTGQGAKSNDSKTWVPFQVAKLALQRFGCNYLGFAFLPPYVGVDIDDKIDSELIKQLDSYTEYSPSKTGVHILCKGTIPKAFKKDGIEVYANGRFFTVTGDTIGSNRTCHERTGVLKELFYQNVETTVGNPKGWISEALDEMKVGNIDNTLIKVLGRMRADNYSKEDAYTLLQPHAEAKGATPGHLEEKIKHVWTTYKPNISGDELLKEAQTHVESGKEGTLDIQDFLDQDETVEWLVPGIVSKQSLGFVGGLPETNKTWICMDLAIECAKGGGYWLGKFPVKDCSVLYIDQERFKGETMRRLRAMLKAKHLNPKDLKLKVKSGTTVRIDLQHSFDAFKREIVESKPDLIIIDSFVTFHTKEENNRKDIQDVLERIKILRNEVGCAFMFIDHENKSVFNAEKEEVAPSLITLSGSIAKPASAEYVLTVRKHEDGASMIYHTKSTQGPTIEPFLVKVTDLKEDKSEISVKAF